MVLSIAALTFVYLNFGRLTGLVGDDGTSGRIRIAETNYSTDPYLNWRVVLVLESVDTDAFILSKVMVNGREVSVYGGKPPSSKFNLITTQFPYKGEIGAGESRCMVVWVGGDFGFLGSENLVSIKIVDAAGGEYLTSVWLT